ncbi:hypothetical protein [Megalodesulfovibrio gigas]|nr:hypothetical protein [Megalodesulfovibrio gigas]
MDKVKRLIAALGMIPAVVVFVGAIYGILSFTLPTSWFCKIEAVKAQKLGLNAMAYYGVATNRSRSDQGQLFLLREDVDASIEHLQVGDKLRAASEVNLVSISNFGVDLYHGKDCTNKPTLEKRTISILQKDECVIVVSDEKMIISKEILDCTPGNKAISGGYIKVATTPCGLF